MLPKPQRLPHGLRLASGNTFKSPHFILKFAPNSLGISRFGIIISKKIDKRAVRRNRMRHLLQSYVRDNGNLFPASMDYLFIVTSAFEEIQPGLAKELEKYFVK